MADDKVNEIITVLKNEYPGIKISLDHSNPWNC